MSTTDHAGGGLDALRVQIESGLRAAECERRRRMGLMAAGVALALSLVANVVVMFAPGVVGLASGSHVDAVRTELRAELAAAGAAQQQHAAEIVATTEAAVRAASRSDAASRALPRVCATLDALGDWSFTSGSAPAVRCAAAR